MLGRLGSLIAVLAAAAALAAPAHAEETAAPPVAPAQMTWVALDRFAGDADGDGLLDGPGAKGALGLDEFPVLVRAGEEVCSAGDAVWKVDGRFAGDVSMSDEGGRCRTRLAVRGEGAHEVTVRSGGVVAMAQVDVDDRLIVALGDSVASGEGNPQGPDRWLDRPCHRSVAAGFEQAARILATGPSHSSITFVSLACSGASIEEGLLGSYDGVAPEPSRADPGRNVVYPPQVERLAVLARSRAAPVGKPAVDAVLLSVGANDLRFAEVVASCGRSPFDCREAKRRQVFADLERLPGNYDRLAGALRTAAPGAPVLISEYFDPTRGGGGDFCGRSLAFTSEDEARWAYEGLLRPLNIEVATAAARNGWRRVGGIAAAFERHGYCADDSQRWVVRLSTSYSRQFDHKGTLHPNERGHAEIAWRVIPPLAAKLGLPRPARPPEADVGLSTEEALFVLAAVLGALAVAFLAFTLYSAPLREWPKAILGWLLFILAAPFVLLFYTVRRLLRLLRPSGRDDPGPDGRAQPEIGPVPRPQGTWQVVLLFAGVVALVLAAVLLARQVGSSILWLRFWSSNLPADQAVSAVPQRELLTTGAHEVSFFFGLGLLAMAVAWLIDGKGRWTRATRRGLLAIGLLEVLAAIQIGDFRSTQTTELYAGLVTVALLLYYLVDRALAPGSIFRTGEPVIDATRERLEALWSPPAERPLRSWALRLWRGLPFLVLLAAVAWSISAGGPERDGLLVLFGLAALLFAGPGGMAAPATCRSDPSDADLDTLETPRTALAVAAVACISILVVRDEAWLAATATMAIVLGLLCLAISAASRERFAPYGLAVLISVPLFGAGAAMVRGIDTPELQPVAAVLNGGRTVCGAYVGESSGRLWFARLGLRERASDRRPEGGEILSVDAGRVAMRSLGPLEPATHVPARAAELRDELLDERGERERRRWPGCAPPPTRVKAQQSWQRRLAERFQPELILDRRDGFWPVPVKTLFSVADRRAGICRRVASGSRNCIRLDTQGQFPWAGGEGEAIEYPAADTDIDAQHDQMVDALGSADPDATATEYFLVTGNPRRGPITIQYWFFYPFNYQPVRGKILQGGFHEGDFESVGVLLSARKREPRYFWMARHNEEGRILPWRDDALTLTGNHPQVFAARGSHASYESCAEQIRFVAKYHLVDDHPTCDADLQLHLSPEVTALTDLSKVAWACWHGNFGHRSGGRAYEQIPYLVADAPLSPLWQQRFGGVVSEPCRDLGDPGGREGPGEEVLVESDRVPRLLRERAGRLNPLVDSCEDWEAPPPTGTFMVACDPAALRSYVEHGFEGAAAPLRIEKADDPAEQDGIATYPAVRRNREGAYLDSWRIVAARRTRITVFASCPGEDGVVAARFANVRIAPGEPLRLLDETPDGWWRLIREDGTRVARSRPFPTKESHGRLVPAAANGERLDCTEG